MTWEPKWFSEDPIANAILNLAAEVNGHTVATYAIASALAPDDGNVSEAMLECANSIQSLLYGLKYGKIEGMSISESVEVVGSKIADALSGVSEALQEVSAIGFRDGESMIVEAGEKISEALESVASSLSKVRP